MDKDGEEVEWILVFTPNPDGTIPWSAYHAEDVDSLTSLNWIAALLRAEAAIMDDE